MRLYLLFRFVFQVYHPLKSLKFFPCSFQCGARMYNDVFTPHIKSSSKNSLENDRGFQDEIMYEIKMNEFVKPLNIIKVNLINK